MKRLKFAAAFLLFAFLFMLAACGKAESVIGGWEAELSVIGLGSEQQETGQLRMNFKDDLSGTKHIAAGGEVQRERPFTYSLSGGVLHIEYEDGTILDYSYTLDENTLILKLGGRELSLTRID